jgi:hypothetical protein
VEEKRRWAIPPELGPFYEQAKTAYDEWLVALDSFFGDDLALAEEAMHDSLLRVVQGASEAGVDPAELSDALRRRFPEACGREFFEAALAPGVTLGAPMAGSPAYPPPPIAAPALRRTCPSCGESGDIASQFCPKCGRSLPEMQASELLPIIQSLAAQVSLLQRSPSSVSGLPHTMILSDNFLTRAFAIYGHSIAAGMIVAVPIYVVFFVIGLIFNAALLR